MRPFLGATSAKLQKNGEQDFSRFGQSLVESEINLTSESPARLIILTPPQQNTTNETTTTMKITTIKQKQQE